MKIQKIFFQISFLFFLISTLQAQKKQNNYWGELLNNNHKKAYDIFNKTEKKYEKSIELLLTREILRGENGFIDGASSGFLQKFMEFEDFEYYMYAFWNSPFLFDNYLTTGFYAKNSTTIGSIDESKVNDKTILYAIKYLKAIVERDNKNLKGYYKYIDEIDVIKKWQYCGVFENLNKSGYDTSYEPEFYAKNDKTFDANSNGLINWYIPHKDFEKESYKFFSNHLEYGYGVNYAQTFITSDSDKRVQLRLGNSSSFKVWLNDVLVYKSDKDVGTDIDAYVVEVNLQKGVNRLLIKNSESNSGAYFIVRFSDTNGNSIDGVTYSNKFSEYNKSTLELINPKNIKNTVEEFFEYKVLKNPNNFFYKYCLIKTYARNQKYEKMNSILNPLMEDYKKSSLLRLVKTYSYIYEGNSNAVNELNKNIFLQDPDYYYSIIQKISDRNVMSRMSISELEEYLEKLKNATDSPILKYLAKFFLDIRNEDLTALKETMYKINEVASDRVFVLRRFIPLLDQVFQEREKAISEYEKILSVKFSPQLTNGLALFYDKNDRKEDVLNLYKEQVENYPSENDFLFQLIVKLHEYKRYDESLPYIKQVLENYPYSFKAMEYMGNALFQLGRKKEALEFYEKSLAYNNRNSKLLKKIETINRAPNLLERYSEENVYNYVEENRLKYKENNYGTNILLDNKVYQIYKNGTIKGKSIYVYEITSSNGIENYKEYNIGLSGNYSISKSEIIKKDKSIIPAEKTGSNFVFNGLEIGDVIYIAYETTTTSSGRFYKDFVDNYQFDSESFCLKTSYTVISPKEQSITYKVTNGNLDYTKKEDGDYDIHNWQLISAEELPKEEDYMPPSPDNARYLHIGTIKSWNEIANWYSDLVRSQSVFNAEVEQKYNEIFPEKDVKSLSEEERARRIYYYIMNNFTYSFVNFKQSGFIPQKPSKTISSKLGDCKDFSTLFATFGRRAGLDVNLVLVLTSDYGKKALIVPSTDFNHCIVKVKLNGKDQFLELTDKNLPFKSIPTSLMGAIALDIPYQANETGNNSLFHLTNLNGEPAKLISDISLKVDENQTQNIIINTKVSGGTASGFFSMLNQANYELIKKDISDDFSYRIANGFVLDSVQNISANIGDEFVTYTTTMKIKDKINKMGSITFFELPLVSHAYNESIINLEERNYPIFYQSYENADFYDSTYTIEVPKGKKIVEMPESQKFSHKGHSFEVKVNSINSNKVKIEVIANTDFSAIPPDEYLNFKNYVEKVLKAKDILIGFK